MIEISIVIPVYNSVDCLSELHRQICNSVIMSHEIIFVNDQSEDNSWPVIKDLTKANKNAIGVNLRKNSGQDNAIMAGMAISKGKYIVIMDDDLQYSPRDIVRLYQKCKEGYDACYAKPIIQKRSLLKNFSSWLNGKCAELFLGKEKSIYLSPFKVIDRALAKEMVDSLNPFPYVDGLILSYTKNIGQIETDFDDRFSGESTYSLIKSLAVLGNHLTGYSVFPLRAATLVGMASAFFGFLLFGFFIAQYFMFSNIPEGWTTLVSLILLIGGVILICLGIIGEYVGRSYLLLGLKPKYSIKEIIRDTNE